MTARFVILTYNSCATLKVEAVIVILASLGFGFPSRCSFLSVLKYLLTTNIYGNERLHFQNLYLLLTCFCLKFLICVCVCVCVMVRIQLNGLQYYN